MRYGVAVIIIGMHRSGTTMVADMLSRCGLFIGSQLENNSESKLMIQLNDWLLAQCGARWDNPAGMDLLLDNAAIRQVTVEYLRAMLSGFGAWRYCGLGGVLTGGINFDRPGETPPSPWGWKDPRNTFTLPVWEDLLGPVRVIHVLRHGCDVADSIIRRSPKLLAASTAKMRKFRRLAWLQPKSGGFVDTLRIGDHESALRLWHKYCVRARQHVTRLGDMATEIRYEDFLNNPASALGELAAFCRLDASSEKIAKVASSARASRRFAFTANEKLTELAGEYSIPLAEFGYGAGGYIDGGADAATAAADENTDGEAD